MTPVELQSLCQAYKGNWSKRRERYFALAYRNVLEGRPHDYGKRLSDRIYDKVAASLKKAKIVLVCLVLSGCIDMPKCWNADTNRDCAAIIIAQK